MILLDSNIPMYIVGASHPNKIQARILLERAISDRERLVTDAEVFQEILHRYSAINRREVIQPAFDALSALVDEVFGVDRAVIEEAKRVILAYRGVSARDAVHLAVMRLNGITHVMSFDTGLDGFPGVTRLS